MRTDKIMGHLPTKAEKDKAWDGFMKRRAGVYDDLARAGHNEPLISCVKNEIFGGDCYRCKKPWKHVAFDTMFGSGSYYMPDCHCFISCPHCKAQLYEEELTGKLGCVEADGQQLYCPSCGYQLIYKGSKRYGAKWDSKCDAGTVAYSVVYWDREARQGKRRRA